MAKTLRDEFAMAVSTEVVRLFVTVWTNHSQPAEIDYPERVAELSYEVANAMMKERLKHNTVEDTTR